MGAQIKWNHTPEVNPTNGQMCWITNEECEHIMGPYPWVSDAESFMDILASPEAGAMYGKDIATYWADESEINTP